MDLIDHTNKKLFRQISPIRALLDSMSAEGIIGRMDVAVPDDDRDDEAIELSRALAELESRIMALPPTASFKEGWLSFVRRAYYSVAPGPRSKNEQLIIEAYIDNLNEAISRTSNLRKKFSVLYSSLFYKNLPCPQPGVLEEWIVHKAALSDYNLATLAFAGSHHSPVFSWLASNPNSVLEIIRLQELTLRSLTRRMIRILNTIHNSKENKDVQLVEKVGILLQDTIINGRRYSRVRMSLDYLIEQASYCISILDQSVQRNRMAMSLEGPSIIDFLKNGLASKISAWQNSLTTLSELQAAVESSTTGDRSPGSSKNVLALFGSALIEEAWRWNASDDELSAWNSGQKVIPLDWVCRDGLRVVLDQLSYRNICKKIEANAGVKVLFDHTPRHQTHQYSGIRAGFSCVRRVTLEVPIECNVTNSVQRLMGRSTTELISEVAVKVIYVGESEQATCLRVAREARAWAQLKHDHINPLLGLWTNFEGSAIPCFVSPWASQGSLPIFLRKNPKASPLQRLQIMRDVADALAFMHSRKFPVVHGDLRGNNVLIHHDRALVCDFGISQVTDGLSGTTTGTHGSWKWMAPEYFYSVEGVYTFKSSHQMDVYSLASVFLEAFTGREPWIEVSMSHRAKHHSDIEPQPEEICDEHWEFLTDCWSLDPLLRPTAKEVFEKMQSFVQKANVERID